MLLRRLESKCTGLLASMSLEILTTMILAL